MSDHSARSLRHALKQIAVTGASGSLLLGAAVAGLAAPAAAPGAAAAAPIAATRGAATGAAVASATVTLHAVPTAVHLGKVNVGKEMRVAASLKGRPYRYGAAGPWAFDCSGYTQYVLKQQRIRLSRTAAGQYRQTRHLAKRSARVGDLVFFYNGGGVHHVGIYAGRGTMWAAPHTGTVVRHEKIYGSNWVIGRIV
ncbi:MAG: C40 family peptidase [Kineosporiaceae bacterium]